LELPVFPGVSLAAQGNATTYPATLTANTYSISAERFKVSKNLVGLA
jgi:hypothetical protein